MLDLSKSEDLLPRLWWDTGVGSSLSRTHFAGIFLSSFCAGCCSTCRRVFEFSDDLAITWKARFGVAVPAMVADGADFHFAPELRGAKYTAVRIWS